MKKINDLLLETKPQDRGIESIYFNMKKYVSGLIPYSPFNVESFDFDLLLDEE